MINSVTMAVTEDGKSWCGTLRRSRLEADIGRQVAEGARGANRSAEEPCYVERWRTEKGFAIRSSV